ncbi:hypothetical protein OG912_20120 [Streptomyces sp. NBC_00464]
MRLPIWCAALTCFYMAFSHRLESTPLVVLFYFLGVLLPSCFEGKLGSA